MAWGVHEVPGAVGRLVCQELLLLGMEADVVAKAPVGSPAGRPWRLELRSLRSANGSRL